MEAETAKEVIKRLDALIFILLNKKAEQPYSLKEQVSLLDSVGFRPIEIASTLGRTPTHITKELTNLRKAKGASKRGKKA